MFNSRKRSKVGPIDIPDEWRKAINTGTLFDKLLNMASRYKACEDEEDTPRGLARFRAEDIRIHFEDFPDDVNDVMAAAFACALNATIAELNEIIKVLREHSGLDEKKDDDVAKDEAANTTEVVEIVKE
jgi:hypothetical protein